MKRIILTCMILSSLLLASCATSVVYSPSLNLPSKPLVKDDLQAGIGYEMLGEARANLTDKNFSNGTTVNLRYGFTNNFALQVKGWYSLEDMKDIQNSVDYHSRQGYSLSAHIILGDPGDTYRYALIPSVGMSIYNTDISGFAGACWFAAWLPEIFSFNPYAAVGLSFGWKNADGIKDEYGTGILGNIGVSKEIYKGLGFNVELAGAYIFNHYDRVSYFVPSPSIGFSYKF